MPHFDASSKKSVAFNKSVESIIVDRTEDVIEDWNEKLRHETAHEAPKVTVWNVLPSEIARSAAVILQECLDEITVLRKMKGIERDDVILEYTPLQEQYSAPKYDMDLILNQSPEALNIKKFKKETSWIEQILKKTILNLKSKRNFDDLLYIMDEEETNRETENTILLSRKFNQNEIIRLRQYMDSERESALKRIQQLTEKLGNCKDELNDQLAEYTVKINYLKNWENARSEQNQLVFRKKENNFIETKDKMNFEIFKEEKIHDDLRLYLYESLGDYKQEIETWMNRYDKELDEKEQAITNIKLKLENQQQKHIELQKEFDQRQEAIELYLEHKRQKQLEYEETEKRRQAATKIQAWWRGTMFRKGLGPYRQKKSKFKKNSSKKKAVSKK